MKSSSLPITFVPSTISHSTRFGLILIAILIMMGLAIARFLEPSPSGFGTHQQMGLPACTIYSVFGLKCPSCGMTTAWSFAVRLQFQEALNANVAGTLLCLQAMLSVPYLLLIVLFKNDPLGRFFSTATVWGVACCIVLAILFWVGSVVW